MGLAAGGISAGTALAIGAGTSAVGAIGSSLIGSSAAQSAASTEAGAADTASQNSLNEYNSTVNNLAPFTNAGKSALGSLETALGLPGGSATNPLTANGLSGLTFQPTQAQLASTPGYQFALAQGLQSTQNSNAAQGLGVSGAALKGAASFATGEANNALATQDQIFQNNLGNVLNPLTNLVGTGQNAAATTGQQGIQAVGNSNNALVTGANDTAAGTVGSANAISSGLSGAASTPLNTLLYSSLLNNAGGGGATGAVDNGTWDSM